MRDPARIDSVLRALGDAWRNEPDLRLGQLVVNALKSAGVVREPVPQVFHAEDDELVEGLREVMRRQARAEDDSSS